MPAPLDTPQLDLDAYLARIGHGGPLDPRHETLEALHRAHALAIPFENLDVLLGRPIRLDLPSVQAKLVTARRGGYCYEQNLLLATALQAIGFGVTLLSARVRYGTTALRPRTHMTLLVKDDRGDWVADVGFGAGGMLGPIPMDGAPARQGRWTHRVVALDAGDPTGRWLVQSRAGGAWEDYYAFTLEPHLPVDYELANHFTATHPASPFTRMPVVQRTTPQGRHTLRGRELTWDGDGSHTTRTLADQAELLKVLEETFGLAFPPDTRFPMDAA